MRRFIVAALLAVVLTFLAIGQTPGTGHTTDILYAVDRERHLWVSEDSGSIWVRAADAIAAAIVGEHDPRITAIATIDNEDDELLVAVGAAVLRSTDQARTFARIDLSAVINPATYVTAIAADPSNPDHIIVGTSYDGIYHSLDGGVTWSDLSLRYRLAPLYLGGGFLEEIAGLRFDGQAPWVIVTLGFGMGTYRFNVDTGVVTRIPPGPRNPDLVSRFPHTGVHADGVLVTARVGPSTVAAADPNVGATVATQPGPNPPLTPAEQQRHARAAERRGIYLSPYRAAELDQYLEYLGRTSLDSVVIDFKDDHGRLTYDSQLELPREIGAVRPVFDAAEVIETAHDAGLYVIARVVVFKDRMLYAYNDHAYALWDSATDRPWGVFRRVVPEPPDDDTQPSPEPYWMQVEHWVDPHAPEVWEYNVAIAEELVALGVDEVQFDYIRFPSDGNTVTVVERFAQPGRDRVDALEGFLSRARAAIDVPISIDVFGFNGWSRMSYLGQDLSVMARHVDVICPMYYPSHFARAFLPWFEYLSRAEYIYREGPRRALRIGESHALIRPYVQAFLIGAETAYDESTYLRYMDLQLEGLAAGPSSGFTLWNASGRYYMYP